MGSRRAAIWRIAIGGVVVGAIFLGMIATGSVPSPDEVRDTGESLGIAALLAFIPLFVLVNFLITWPILAGAAGLLFGTIAGFPLALAGLTAAALTQMWLARRLAAGHHGNLLPQRTKAIEDFLTRNGALAVMESRILPLLPYGLVNYSAGLTKLRFRDMTAGTIVGAAPKVFAYVALGGSLGNLTSPEAIAAVTLIIVLGLIGLLVARRQLLIERRARPA
jgi:uncharacterized membrane protein YdjX (TVP38/TMEM64 family)